MNQTLECSKIFAMFGDLLNLHNLIIMNVTSICERDEGDVEFGASGFISELLLTNESYFIFSRHNFHLTVVHVSSNFPQWQEKEGKKFSRCGTIGRSTTGAFSETGGTFND